MNLAVLITCHNRREKTLRCLRSLARASEKCDVINEKLLIDIFLVDDGSTDGTAEAVQEWYENLPPLSTSTFNLHLIAAFGDLFWAKGMALAWREALKYEKSHLVQLTTNNQQPTTSFSHFLWLNDDVELLSNALEKLLTTVQRRPPAISRRSIATSHLQPVVIGECRDPMNESLKTYGIQGRWFNGNVVLVPREVCEKVGIIDDNFSHAKADFDYAERLHRADVPIVAAEDFAGTCADDWTEKLHGKNLFARLALLFRPSNFNLHDLWRFQSRYFGRLHAIGCCLKLFWQMISIPTFREMWESKSRARP